MDSTSRQRFIAAPYRGNGKEFTPPIASFESNPPIPSFESNNIAVPKRVLGLGVGGGWWVVVVGWWFVVGGWWLVNRIILPCQNGYYNSNIKVLSIVVKVAKKLRYC